MNPTVRKGLVVAALHVAVVASLGAKLLVDRATRPRVWARAAPFDPNLPIRGRYVRLRVEAVPAPGLRESGSPSINVVLSELNGRLVASPTTAGGLSAQVIDRSGERRVTLMEPLAYFIPEHVADPSRRPSGEELWVEVTIPRAGAPRPIRLGVMKDGALKALEE